MRNGQKKPCGTALSRSRSLNSIRIPVCRFFHMKYGRSGTYTKELWIDRREKSKSLVWSSVRAAYHKVLELQEESARPVVDRPKDLGDIRGITYIYGIFYAFGLLEMPEKAKEKLAMQTEVQKTPEK